MEKDNMQDRRIAIRPTEGTYVAVFFTEETKQNLFAITQRLKLPNQVNPEKYHTTVVYSRKVIDNYKLDEGIKGQTLNIGDLELEIWQSPADVHVCVATYRSHILEDRVKYAKSIGATFDYPTYNPHVTLSYDIAPDFNLDFKSVQCPIIGDFEMQEDLQQKYAKDRKKYFSL